MAIFKRRKKDERPLETLFYRDYIKSTFWELRKRRYFERYGNVCQICGDSDRLGLEHIKHGDYGHERDSDLVALCHEHQGKLSEIADEAERRAYIRAATAKHEAEQENKIEEPVYQYSPSFFSSVHTILDAMARPIWRLFYGFFRW